jgi:ADP-ribose pyrophosphatase
VRPEARRTVYDGDYLSVSVETWHGREREIVERPDVVATVPVDREGLITLVRQVRPPARAALLELPAGRIETGEEPLASAQRELAEETGLHGGTWREGPSFWTTPGFCRERVHLFFAEDLERGVASPEDGEEIEIVRMPLGELEARLGDVADGKTLIGLLLHLEDCRRKGRLFPVTSTPGDTVRPE